MDEQNAPNVKSSISNTTSTSRYELTFLENDFQDDKEVQKMLALRKNLYMQLVLALLIFYNFF